MVAHTRRGRGHLGGRRDAASSGSHCGRARVLHVDLGYVDRIPSNRRGHPAAEGDFRGSVARAQRFGIGAIRIHADAEAGGRGPGAGLDNRRVCARHGRVPGDVGNRATQSSYGILTSAVHIFRRGYSSDVRDYFGS